MRSKTFSSSSVRVTTSLVWSSRCSSSASSRGVTRTAPDAMGAAKGRLAAIERQVRSEAHEGNARAAGVAADPPLTTAPASAARAAGGTRRRSGLARERRLHPSAPASSLAGASGLSCRAILTLPTRSDGS